MTWTTCRFFSTYGTSVAPNVSVKLALTISSRLGRLPFGAKLKFANALPIELWFRFVSPIVAGGAAVVKSGEC